jgi:hypothetical protein
MNVWYFDKPTIGYCRRCEATLMGMTQDGLRCTICRKTDKVSIFEWDGFGPYPEEEVLNSGT